VGTQSFRRDAADLHSYRQLYACELTMRTTQSFRSRVVTAIVVLVALGCVGLVLQFLLADKAVRDGIGISGSRSPTDSTSPISAAKLVSHKALPPALGSGSRDSAFRATSEPFSETYARASGSDTVASLELRAGILLTCLQVEREKKTPVPAEVARANRPIVPASDLSARAVDRLRALRSSQRCASFAMPENSYALARELMRRAAAMGGKVSNVFLIEDTLTQNFEPLPMRGFSEEMLAFMGQVGSVDRLAQEQFNTLMDAIKSADPEAVLAAVPVLLGWFRETEVVIAGMPGNVAFDESLIVPLSEILACRLGAACGEETPTLLAECARNGTCNYRSIEEYYLSQTLDPDRRNAVQYLLARFDEAYRTGDWSFLTLVTNPVVAPRMRVPFRPTPRFPRIGV
jgi:hypothetical protein